MTQGFTSGMRSSLDDTWTTPKDFFANLHEEFNFALDAAALKSSAVVPNYLGPDHEYGWRRDALTVEWDGASGGGAVWLNPPYGRAIKEFVAKADTESNKGITVVCLVPARTDTNWWWDSCIHHEVRFIKGRLKFGGQKNSAPFPSAVIVMRKH
jgi:site-specific DNA-methyltransferase (adenine-specific)